MSTRRSPLRWSLSALYCLTFGTAPQIAAAARAQDSLQIASRGAGLAPAGVRHGVPSPPGNGDRWMSTLAGAPVDRSGPVSVVGNGIPGWRRGSRRVVIGESGDRLQKAGSGGWVVLDAVVARGERQTRRPKQHRRLDASVYGQPRVSLGSGPAVVHHRAP